METVEELHPPAPGDRSGRAPSLVRDVPLVATGAALSSLFGILQVFIIPKITTVEEFGYWRLFLLYASYAGLLHLGFGEGVFVRWAGRDFKSFHHEIGPSVRFLIAVHACLLLVAGVVGFGVLAEPLRTIAISLMVYAAIANLVTILQLSLQAARDFLPVTISAVAPAAIFVTFILLLALIYKPGHRELIFLYAVAWSTALSFLWNRVAPFSSPSKLNLWSFAFENIRTGWPITLASFGFDFFASADRFVVSTAASIRHFAQYSLAASIMTIPLTVIGTVYRVFLPHLATKSSGQQAASYHKASRLVLLGWVVLLPYYVAVDLFVRRFLPVYQEALPIARVLVLAVLFLALIRILQMSIFNLSGNQRRFLVSAGAAVILSLSMAFVGFLLFRSLVLVACTQVFTAALWWTANEILLTRIVQPDWNTWMQFVFVFAWSAAALLLVTRYIPHPGAAVVAYYAAVMVPVLLCCGDELRLAIGLLYAGNR
jgi:O-antigen/teichoic acid export membrane protein